MNCRYALSSRSVVVSRSRLPSISEAFQRPRIVKGHASSATLEADGFGCLLLEIDGAVTDLHMDGHRVAFNKSLARMGYECAQFTPPIYNDLLQGGDGTAEGLVTSYFMRMGWPMMLATSDQPLFIKKICLGKREELSRLFREDGVPLRPHVKEVIADALADSVQVGLIAGTLSDNGDEVAASVLRQLGPDVGGRVRVFNCNQSNAEADKQSDTTQEEGASVRSIGQVLKEATAAEKQRTAAAFVDLLKQQPGSEGGAADVKALLILLDSSLTGASNRRTVTPELLAALAAALGVHMASCILLGASVGVTQAGADAGMMAVAVPRRLALQGTYPGVAAKVEGYGPGYCTWGRLRSMLKARSDKLS